jgi:glycosyltransferase involved in cell wall biosynthesis
LAVGDAQIHEVRAGIAMKLWCENVSIRSALTSWPADRLFSLTDSSVPFVNCPHLLLVHQAHLVYAPDAWGFDAPPSLRLRMGLMTAYLRQTLRSVTRVTVQSQDMKTRLCERFDVADQQVVVVPSAVTLAPADLEEGGERPEREAMTLLCVSSAAPHKNIPVLFDMLRALEPRHGDVRLQLTMEGEAHPDLVGAAKDRGVLDRVDFLGRCSREQIQDLSRRATLALQPSLLESFGLTYYESMAVGLPLVVADRAFAREACGDAARYAEGCSGESFAAQVDALLDRPSEAHDLAELARRRVEALGWDWARVGSRYLDLVERLE